MGTPPAGRRGRGPLRGVGLVAVVVLVALALRVVPVAFHRFRAERVLALDSPLYLELARNLREHGSFRRTGPERGTVENPGEVEVFRTPGYPLFLASFGAAPERVTPAAIGAQIVLDALAAGLVAAIAATLMPPRWALVAGLLAAADVAHVVYANMIMTDTVFAALLIAGVWLLVRPAPAHPLAACVAAGLVFSAGAAVRPVGALAALAGALYLLARREERRRVAAFVLAGVAFPLAWTVRNGTAAGVWAVSDAGAYNLCVVAAAKVEAAAGGIPRREAERALIERAVRASPGADSAARSAAFRRVGVQVIAAHPWLAVREAFASAAEFALAGERRYLLRMFGAEGGADDVPALGESARAPGALAQRLGGRDRLEVAIVAAQAAWNLALWVAAAVGAAALARSRRWPELVLLVSVIAYQAAASLVVGHGRMRLPISGVLAVLAALGLARLLGRRAGAPAGPAQAPATTPSRARI